MPEQEWSARYEEAQVAGQTWIDCLLPDDRLFIASASAEPIELVSTLTEAVRGKHAATPLTVFQMPAGRDSPLLSVAGEHLRFVALFFHPSLRNAASQSHTTFLPLSIYQVARAIREGRIGFDVVLIETSPPDERGFMSLGASVDFTAQAMGSARIVIAEVNDRAPRTLGNSFVHISQISALVETSREPATFETPPQDEIASRVAEHVVTLVPDRSTIEIGIGAVMTGVLARLKDRDALGLHTGLIVEPMIDLIAAGKVTNEWKGIDTGVTVANQCRGGSRLYSFLDNNPAITLQPAQYTHDPKVLYALKQFRAINSAIEVDLLGQVNSEFIGGRRVAGVGGLVDFVHACHVSEDARSIIALRSTTSDGQRTRIVPTVADGGGVSLTADLADVVVTEHGAAELRGLDAAERARAMIAIADPRFRDELEKATLKEGV